MELFRFIVHCSNGTPKLKTDDECTKRRTYCQRVNARLGHYEAAHGTLKEATTTLELTIWKAKINESTSVALENRESCNKKSKTDDTDLRKQCRINCWANVIIRNVVRIFCVWRNQAHWFSSFKVAPQVPRRPFTFLPPILFRQIVL